MQLLQSDLEARTRLAEVSGLAPDAFPFFHVATELVLLLRVEAASCREQAAAYLAGGGRVMLTRRAHAVSLLVAAVVVATLAAHVRAEQKKDGGEGVLGAIKSIFDPNDKTKAGKVLPKAYLKAAREVVRTLRESLEGEDAGDVAKFRRGADAAKESIREFLGGWRGQQAVAAEDSYVALERAIRSPAESYSNAGPFASLRFAFTGRQEQDPR